MCNFICCLCWTQIASRTDKRRFFLLNQRNQRFASRASKTQICEKSRALGKGIVMQPSTSSVIYQICIKGHLDEHWMRWFESLAVSQQPNGETVISDAIDQATLHGILNRIRDLSLELISVQRYPAENKGERP